MPDLQTALSSVAKQINFDDDLDAPTEYKNFAQKLFYWFVDNPASTAQEAKNALSMSDDGPVSGRIFQMWTRGILSRTKEVGGAYRYTATCTKYPEFTTEQRQEMIKKAQAARRKPKKIKVVPTPPKAAPSLNANPNAEQIVNSMSVGLAKAVYLELKKVFEA